MEIREIKSMPTTQEQGVSIRPSDAQQSGLIDDFDGTITDAKFVKWNYNGKQADVIALAVEIKPDEDEAFTQFYSVGQKSLQAYVILTGNTKVRAIDPERTKGLPNNSNAMKFLNSFASGAMAVGFTEDQMSDDVNILVGFRGHFTRVANVNKGLKQQKKEGDRDNMILLVEKILSKPTDNPQETVAKAKRGRPAGAPKATTAAPAQAQPQSTGNGHAEASDSTAVDTVMTILASQGGSATKQVLAGEAYKMLNGNPDRNKLISVIAQDAFLNRSDQPWKYDGSMVSLG